MRLAESVRFLVGISYITAVADSPWISGMSHDKNVLRRGEDDSIGTAFAASVVLGFGSPAPMQKS